MTQTKKNTVVLMARDPGEGWIQESDMKVEVRDFDPDTVQLKDGELLVHLRFFSLDPYMRGRFKQQKSYVEPFKIGKPLITAGVGEVYASKNDKFKKGSLVYSMCDWAEWAVLSADAPGLRPLEDVPGVKLSYHLGVLGMPGLTAYGGLMKIGKPKKGETVYVSGAAGAVGLVVGQIAKNKGFRVVGSAGSDEKVKLLRELGFDAVFNYKSVESYDKALAEHCPNGIDVYFDNVGGEALSAVLSNMNNHGRIAACGAISQYNGEGHGIKNLFEVVKKRILIQGFLVGEFYTDADLMKNFQQDVVAMVKDNKMKVFEHVVKGVENAPRAFIGMLKGDNTGKQIIEI